MRERRRVNIFRGRTRCRDRCWKGLILTCVGYIQVTMRKKEE